MAKYRVMMALSVAALLGFHQLASATSDFPWATVCIETKGFHDGDTLTCISSSTGRGTFKVRFAGIDAPETGQAFWKASRDLLQKLVLPGTQAQCYKQDFYGRAVCRLKSPAGEDIAEVMLRQGFAWHAVKFAHEQTLDERKRYSLLEAEAKQGKLGLWADATTMAPWDCRQLRREKQSCR